MLEQNTAGDLPPVASGGGGRATPPVAPARPDKDLAKAKIMLRKLIPSEEIYLATNATAHDLRKIGVELNIENPGFSKKWRSESMKRANARRSQLAEKRVKDMLNSAPLLLTIENALLDRVPCETIMADLNLEYNLFKQLRHKIYTTKPEVKAKREQIMANDRNAKRLPSNRIVTDPIALMKKLLAGERPDIDLEAKRRENSRMSCAHAPHCSLIGSQF